MEPYRPVRINHGHKLSRYRDTESGRRVLVQWRRDPLGRHADPGNLTGDVVIGTDHGLVLDAGLSKCDRDSLSMPP